MIKLTSVRYSVVDSIRYSIRYSVINSTSQNRIWQIVVDCVEKLVLTMVEYIYAKEFTYIR